MCVGFFSGGGGGGGVLRSRELGVKGEGSNKINFTNFNIYIYIYI